MATTKPKRNRREEILQALALMLENSPGERITTARLAKQVGVSEAALYRHFPSKARMFEGLIEYVENTLLTRVNRIMEDEKDTIERCHHILLLLLTFSERNPGLTRVMTGDALMGEHERLRVRIERLYERFQTQLKQILREKALRDGQAFKLDESSLANLLLAYADGRICQYVRSQFVMKPTTHFDEQWSFMREQLLHS